MHITTRIIRRIKLFQWLCGKITGHSPGTDWGYGMGTTADVWCKYCDKMFQVPIHEIKRLHPLMTDVVEGITGEAPQHLKALSKPKPREGGSPTTPPNTPKPQIKR